MENLQSNLNISHSAFNWLGQQFNKIRFGLDNSEVFGVLSRQLNLGTHHFILMCLGYDYVYILYTNFGLIRMTVHTL